MKWRISVNDVKKKEVLFQYRSSELHDTRHISYIFKHTLKRHEKESQQNFLCTVQEQTG